MERGGIPRPHENACADDAADTQEQQVPRPQGSFQFAGFGFALDLGDGLSRHHPSPNTHVRCACHHNSLCFFLDGT